MFLKIHEIHLHMKCGVPIAILYYAHILHIYCVLAMEKIIGVDQIRIFREKKLTHIFEWESDWKWHLLSTSGWLQPTMDGIGVAVAAKLLLVIVMRTNYKAILGIFMNQAVQWNGMGCWKPLLVADWRGSYYQISGRLSKAKKLKSRVETTCISWNFRKAEHHSSSICNCQNCQMRALWPISP
jgi:hypothetical protein